MSSGALATRVSRAEHAIMTGSLGLTVIFIKGGLEDDLTGECCCIVGEDGSTFRRRTNDESQSAFQARMKRDALTEHATLVIFGGLPPDVDQRLLDSAGGEA